METNHPASPRDAATQAVTQFTPTYGRPRIDGWTPEKQRLFCETLADSGLVREAAEAVGMTPQSCYRLRRRAEGKGFALAWDAALYLARQRLLDLALERAVDGSLETIYDGDGQIVRQRRKQDTRLLLATITKLGLGPQYRQTALSIAAEFDGFLDCMVADANANATISVPGDAQTRALSTPHYVRHFLADREPNSIFEQRDHSTMLCALQRNRIQALTKQND
jgi:hypothetical protein